MTRFYRRKSWESFRRVQFQPPKQISGRRTVHVSGQRILSG
jgi:hypothetical protein